MLFVSSIEPDYMTFYILWCILMIIPHLENSDKNLKFVLSQSWAQCQPVLITCSLWRVIIKEIIELNQSSLKGQRWNSATKISKTKILKKKQSINQELLRNWRKNISRKYVKDWQNILWWPLSFYIKLEIIIFACICFLSHSSGFGWYHR